MMKMLVMMMMDRHDDNDGGGVNNDNHVFNVIGNFQSLTLVCPDLEEQLPIHFYKNIITYISVHVTISSNRLNIWIMKLQ